MFYACFFNILYSLNSIYKLFHMFSFYFLQALWKNILKAYNINIFLTLEHENWTSITYVVAFISVIAFNTSMLMRRTFGM
jgi:hypothetical protein